MAKKNAKQRRKEAKGESAQSFLPIRDIRNGMVEPRNAVETGFLLFLVGAPERLWIPMSGTLRVVVMTVTLLPLGVVSLMGVDGGSLFQYLWHILRFWTHRRKLHFRRVSSYGKEKRKTKKKGG